MKLYQKCKNCSLTDYPKRFLLSYTHITIPYEIKRIREERQRLDLTQAQLAEDIDILAGYILLFYQPFYQIADIFFIIANCYIQSGSPCTNVLLPIRTVISRPSILPADIGEKEERMLYLGTWR